MSNAARRGRFKGQAAFGGNTSHIVQSGVSEQLLKSARQSGQLNLSNRSLSEIPATVWRINIDAPAEARSSTFETDDRWWDQVELSKLLLASNKLQSISDDIKLLHALVTLDIHDNELTSLPDGIGELQYLQRVNLGHNKLTGLPPALFQCNQIRYLYIEHNKLKNIPVEIGSLSDLEDLNISNNSLTELPESIGQLSSLRKLDMSNNQLAALPSNIQFLKGLAMLDLTHNQLTSLPDEISLLRSIEQLYARHNRLQKLPLLENCTNLKELHLGNNLIKDLNADHLKSMQALHVLDLRDNKVASVPDEIVLLTALERLDLTNNDVSGLPFEMGNMVKLQSLVVDGNPMRTIRRDIIARGSEGIKKYLRSRIEVPVETQQVKGVQDNKGQSGIIGGGDAIDAHSVGITKSLDYSGKRAEDVPADIWELAVQQQITSLNLSKNQLKDVPANMMVTVDWLTSVNLGFNKISILNPDISLFLELTDLDLRNNTLSILPPAMESLQKLRTLNLSCNRFAEVPAVCYKFPEVENLLLSDNQVNSIDAMALQKLSKLSCLDLQNNNLTKIPPELGNCTSLRSLLLVGNPCKNPRPAILTKGTVALLDYLRDRIVQ